MAGQKVDYAKKYLEKVNSKLVAVDGQDPFYEFCSNAINGGDNILFQKYRMETRLFDFDWINAVEDSLDKIDNIIRNPKSFIKEDQEVVPIEKAKRTGYEAVKHLSSHSQFVKEVTPDGFIRPSKILTSERNIDYAIYENRFVKTLLLKLVPFVEKRYDALVKLMNSDYFNKMNSKSKFNFNGTDVEYELNMSIHRKINDGDKAEHNALLLERAKIVRQRVMGFYTSEFMANLASAREVFPPIQRTNILMKEPNYHKCYQLWAYIAEQGEFKYEIDVKEAEVDFSREYKEQVKHLTLLAYAVSAANDPAFANAAFDKNVFVPIKPKEMKVLKDIDEEARDNSLKMETDIINEFYYQEARKLYRKNIDSMVNDGEPYHIALKDVYMQATKITDAIFNNLLEVPDDVKDSPVALLRFKKRKLEAFKAIIKFKEQDMNKWRKAQNKLENDIIKDTVKANIALGIKDKETLEKERKAAEQVLAKERAKEAARLKKEAEKQKAKEAIEKAKAKEAAKKAKEAEQARLAREAAKQAREDERIRKAMEKQERERIAEEKRLAREAAMAEKAKLAEEKRLAKEAEEAEKARKAEEARIAKDSIEREKNNKAVAEAKAAAIAKEKAEKEKAEKEKNKPKEEKKEDYYSDLVDMFEFGVAPDKEEEQEPEFAEQPIEEPASEEIPEEAPQEAAPEEPVVEEAPVEEDQEETPEEQPQEEVQPEEPQEEVQPEEPQEESVEDAPASEEPTEDQPEEPQEEPVEEAPVDEGPEAEQAEETSEEAPAEEAPEEQPSEETPEDEPVAEETPVEEPQEEAGEEPTEETPEEPTEDEPQEDKAEEGSEEDKPRRRGLFANLFGRRNNGNE